MTRHYGPRYATSGPATVPVEVGDRLAFPETGRLWWRVRAVRGDFAVLTQQVPFQKHGTLRYTVVDTAAGVRGPCNLIGQGWPGIETDRGCRVLALAMSLGVVEISHRNNVAAEIVTRYPPARSPQ